MYKNIGILYFIPEANMIILSQLYFNFKKNVSWIARAMQKIKYTQIFIYW